MLSSINLDGPRKKQMKTFIKTLAGSAVGVLVYNLLTSPLVGGFHLVPTLVCMLILGSMFGIFSSIFGTRPIQCFINGLATEIGFGALVFSLLGAEQFQANIATQGLLPVILSTLFASSLMGLGGLLAMRITSSRI
jgi:hypothetical protein